MDYYQIENRIIHKQLLMFIKTWKTIIRQKKEVLIVFDDMTAEIEPNEKLSPIVTELFLRRNILNILLTFIAQSCFKERETIPLKIC